MYILAVSNDIFYIGHIKQYELKALQRKVLCLRKGNNDDDDDDDDDDDT
jgi:hypothetical protein